MREIIMWAVLLMWTVVYIIGRIWPVISPIVNKIAQYLASPKKVSDVSEQKPKRKSRRRNTSGKF